EHGVDTRRSMQFDAPFDELHRKRRRMRPFFLAALNCLVRNKPRIPATTQIVSASMSPSRNVALVLIRHAKRNPIQFDATRLREMKNVFVAIVEKSLRIDRLEMAKRTRLCSPGPVARLEPGIDLTGRRPVATEFFNRNGFDPVNRVLQQE